MAEARHPNIYSIAAHRGFADALVAGLFARHFDSDLGLSRLTLLLPSSRAARTVSEAFIRLAGEEGLRGLLMPRMAMVGDLDLDETLGSLIDPLGASDIPPAVDPMRRWLELAGLLKIEIEELGRPLPGSAGLMRLARETAATMDRLLVEEITPDDLTGAKVLDMLGNLSGHWQDSIRLFARVQARWRSRLEERGEVDAATRRNMLFERAARRWRETPPDTPIIAAGVTSASPALARMLRSISLLPDGAVILPDLDLSMDGAAWDELGLAGQAKEPDGPVFARGDALTHPQYHLKLLLNRMNANREEVQQWHRKGIGAASPERTHAISTLFLPPEASKSWVDLEAKKRRLSGVRLLTMPTSEEEAQAIALLVRQALETPEKRVAVVTPDRALARRVVRHLERWNIAADDTAGRPLNLTAAGRFILQLAEAVTEDFAPVQMVAALAHPLVRRGEERREWLANLRQFERRLRGPKPLPGLAVLTQAAGDAGVAEWWDEEVLPILSQLGALEADAPLAEVLDCLATAGEALAGEGLWAQEDGRALSRFIEDLRANSLATQATVETGEIHAVLSDAMEQVAVRPPYGGHPRVAIYGLLESRMTRADLVICSGLNEGTWPGASVTDSLLAPPILRALGVPGADFRIGLSAHDLAGALGAPEVVLSRAERDMDGPTIPSRFVLRIEALLSENADRHRDKDITAMAGQLDRETPAAEPYPRPRPNPKGELRDVPIKVTALDRLLGDPYQFYAQEILALRPLDPLEADATPALQGTLAHKVLEVWHKAREKDPKTPILPIAAQLLRESNLHPVVRGLWQPRLFAALQWIGDEIARLEAEGRTVIGVERKGSMTYGGVRVYGRADRIDRMPDGTLAIVDYKTGQPPSAAKVEAGYALQLGLLGLIAREGDFEGLTGEANTFEYWSLAKNDGDFGFVDEPLKTGGKRSGLTADEFLPRHEQFLEEAISRFVKGTDPFTAKENPDYPGYTDFDQLMRLEEWQIRVVDLDNGESGEGGE
ncbi:ATP-dependent nuclease subunit B [Altererythrobacter epoxidivorans]|uniref:ATP-dependent nuclease subunit B n=1 Tax=Altererythrobacter epoxidivorans TaxID=361183 RepID=A0A0M4M3K9_9SPHN|nr:PD-(D/E)XK nuclease family protein [Altererythrobacter epoxidivorans]ALE16253.1 ATP-dependent nuclease subunit B [Altererythrobacter epoxidivorans]